MDGPRIGVEVGDEDVVDQTGQLLGNDIEPGSLGRPVGGVDECRAAPGEVPTGVGTGAQRSGSKGASCSGATPVTICSASRRPVTGPRVMPHMP